MPSLAILASRVVGLSSTFFCFSADSFGSASRGGCPLEFAGGLQACSIIPNPGWPQISNGSDPAWCGTAGWRQGHRLAQASFQQLRGEPTTFRSPFTRPLVIEGDKTQKD